VTDRIVTAVRDRGARGVEVHLDGAPWRIVPLDCAVEARLGIGVRLDRGRARDLNRSLRRRRGVAVAVRALRHADHTEATLDARLAERGISEPDRRATLDVLQAAGLVDDERVAATRADLLARRGFGDAAVRHDLESRGIDPETVGAVLHALEPEHLRAARVVAERGRSPRTARLLASRGFSDEIVESVIAAGEDEGLG
jgi:SOS response regulatory protein OraA/RecX